LEYGDQVYCTYQSVSQSGNVSFSDIDVPDGSYFAIVGLSESAGCNPFPSIDTSRWMRIQVGDSICDSVPRVMRIQYDCQVNCDIRGSYLQTRLDDAFRPAQTTVTWHIDNTTLPESTLVGAGAVAQYINENYDFQDSMYVVGIKDWTNRNPADAGITGNPAGGEIGDPRSWSVLYVGVCKDKYSAAPYNWPDFFFVELWSRLVVHELGHQRADLTHSDDSVSLHDAQYYCVMRSGIPIDIDTHYPIMGYWVYFCDSCSKRISLETW
jgi:hypothetical protein